MLSKRSYFDFGIFRKTVTRFWPIAALYLGIWVLIMPLNYVRGYYYNDVHIEIVQYIPQGSVVMTFIFSCFAALAVFSYLYNLRSAVMYHSLPVKREAIFLSNYAAGLSFMIVPNIIIYVMTLLVIMFGHGLNGDVITALNMWFASTAMMCVFFYSFAVMLGMIVGTWFMMPVLYGILNFTAVVIENIVNSALEVLVYGYRSGQTVMTILSPGVHMMSEFRFYRWIDSVRYLVMPTNDLIYMLVLTVVGIGFTVLSLYMYKKRDMENAGEIIAVPVLRPVFKYCFSAGCAIVIGAFMYGIMGIEHGIAMYLFALIGGAVGYIVSVMALRKSFRIKMSAVKGFAVFAAVVTVLFCAVSFDLFGVESYIPSASRVENAYITVEGDQLSVTEGDISLAELTTIHRKIISQKNESKAALNDGEYYSTSYSYHHSIYVMIEYETALRTVRRRYTLPVTDELLAAPGSAQSLISDAVNDIDYLLSKYEWAFGTNLPYQVQMEMYEYGEIEEKFGVMTEPDPEGYYEKPDLNVLNLAIAEPDVRISSLVNALKSDIMSGGYDVLTVDTKISTGSVTFYYMTEKPNGNSVDYQKTTHYMSVREGSELEKLVLQYLLEANTAK